MEIESNTTQKQQQQNKTCRMIQCCNPEINSVIESMMRRRPSSIKNIKNDQNNDSDTSSSSSSYSPAVCQICLGILSPPTSSCTTSSLLSPFLQELKLKISEALNVYNSKNNGVEFSSTSPTISLSPELYLRAYAAFSLICRKEEKEQQQDSDANYYTYDEPVEKLVTDHMKRIKDILKEYIRDILYPSFTNNNANNEKGEERIMKPPNEEGTINMHISLTSSKRTLIPLLQTTKTSKLSKSNNNETNSTNPNPTNNINFFNDLQSQIFNNEKVEDSIKHIVKTHEQKNIKVDKVKKRKRFRGDDPTSKQGGDPASNLEKSVLSELKKQFFVGHDNNSNNNDNHSKETQAQGTVVTSLTVPNVQKLFADLETCKDMYKNNTLATEWRQCLIDWFLSCDQYGYEGDVAGQRQQQQQKSFGVDIHVAAWRQPFYIAGRYTKSRRDVSQSPFYVPFLTNNNNDTTTNNMNTQHHGQTSTSADGNSQNNNNNNNNKSNKVRKGITSVEEQICSVIGEFACGGISTQNNSIDDGKENDRGGKIVYGKCKFHASGREDMNVRMMGMGRPFVLEIFDAHSIPTPESLQKACDELHLNHTPKFGVGIVNSDLKFVNSKAFSNLQSDTENKIKHYVCLCWSQKDISSEEWLNLKLNQNASSSSSSSVGAGTAATENENDNNGMIIGMKNPLKIIQATPIRVLHRRAAMDRIRYIVSLRAELIDKNNFRLFLSTSAGTYVKEFVHGDLGRTQPNVRSLMFGNRSNNKVDILQLDVMGIDDRGMEDIEIKE